MEFHYKSQTYQIIYFLKGQDPHYTLMMLRDDKDNDKYTHTNIQYKKLKCLKDPSCAIYVV